MAEARRSFSSSRMEENNREKTSEDEDDSDDVYEVEKIVARTTTKRGKTLYRVRWLGYSAAWDTWEPYENLMSCQAMVDAYNAQQKKLEEEKSMKEYDSEIFSRDSGSDAGGSCKDSPEEKRLKQSEDIAKKNMKKPSYYYVSSSDEDNFDTLKDKFWRDLEEGKIDVFSNDLYSKVKERRVSHGRQSTESQEGCSSTSGEPSQRKRGRHSASSSVKSLKTHDGSRKRSKETWDNESISRSTWSDCDSIASSASSKSKRKENKRKKKNAESEDIKALKLKLKVKDEEMIIESPLSPNVDEILEAQDPEIKDEDSSEYPEYFGDWVASACTDTGSPSCKPSGPTDATGSSDAPVMTEPTSSAESGGIASPVDHQKNVLSCSVVLERIVITGAPSPDLKSKGSWDCDNIKGVACDKLDSGGESLVSNVLACEQPNEPSCDRSAQGSIGVAEVDSQNKQQSSVSTSFQSNVTSDYDISVDNVDRADTAGTTEAADSIDNHNVSQQRLSECASPPSSPKPSAWTSTPSPIHNQDPQTNITESNPATSPINSDQLDDIQELIEDDQLEEVIELYSDDDVAPILDNMTENTQTISADQVPKPCNPTEISDEGFGDCDSAMKPMVEQSLAIPSKSEETVWDRDIFNSRDDIHNFQTPVQSKRLDSADSQSSAVSNSGPIRTSADPRSALTTLSNNNNEATDCLDFDLSEISSEWQGKTMEPISKEPLDLTNAQLNEAVRANDYYRVRQALRYMKQYDMDQQDAQGFTMIMFCAQRGYDDVLEILVKYGANLNAEMKNGITPLMLAAEQGLRCTVELMLLMGAHMNAVAHNGETAIVKAVKKSHKVIVKVLLDYGANFSSPFNGETPVKCAKLYKNTEILEVVSNHIARLTAEYENQVLVTLNNTAKIQCALFPVQCFSLCENDKFTVTFKHDLQTPLPGVGMLLFVAHARVTPQEVRCRFYGPCAVTAAKLNGATLIPLTEEGNYVLSFTPLLMGRNELEIHTVRAPTSKAKLIVSAYKAQLI